MAVATSRSLAPAEAVEAWLAACDPNRLETEHVSTACALGRVTAEPAWALRSSPAFPAAAMDGIAVRAADSAGAAPDRPLRLRRGAFDVVDTGDPVPASRDAVVPREHVEFEAGDVAVLTAEVERGRHVRPVGEDVAAGELLFARGRRLGPFDLALAAAAGVADLPVLRRPVVAILPTGDELRPAGEELAPGELADTNSLMLAGQARAAGCATLCGPIVPDDPEQLASALEDAAEEADLVILVAGTSAGRHDFAPAVLRRCGQVVAHGIALRPGHPAVLGAVAGTPVLCCPGYPVSAALAFDALVPPLLAAFERTPPPRRTAVTAELAAGVHSKPGSRELVRARLGTVDGRRVAVPLRRGASVLSALAHADALIAIAPGQDGLCAGASVDAELLRGDREHALLVAGAADPALERLRLVFPFAFCELAPADALALVGHGGCHAAAYSGRLTDDRLVGVRLADVEVVLAGRRVIGAGDRVAVGPHGTPGRRLFEFLVGDCERLQVRSDAAAFAAVAAGHADAAVGAAAAAGASGLRTVPFGTTPLDLVVRRGAPDRDAALRALLQTAHRPT